MDVHDRIWQLLNERNWSLYKLAHEACLSETTVYDWFNKNHFTPSRKSIEAICIAFEISLSVFYNDIEVDNLNNDEKLLLELFAKVPITKKTTVIEVVRSFTL